ncbi:MAG: hypothetical protein SGPRY_008401, partial [Prymnesium sp.]
KGRHVGGRVSPHSNLVFPTKESIKLAPCQKNGQDIALEGGACRQNRLEVKVARQLQL